MDVLDNNLFFFTLFRGAVQLPYASLPLRSAIIHRKSEAVGINCPKRLFIVSENLL